MSGVVIHSKRGGGLGSPHSLALDVESVLPISTYLLGMDYGEEGSWNCTECQECKILLKHRCSGLLGLKDRGKNQIAEWQCSQVESHGH